MKDTLQPQVTVKIPEVKLKIEDLTYLRSLSGDAKVHCFVPQRQLSRLRILGLVEEKEIPASPRTVADANAWLEKSSIQLRSLLDAKDWEGLSQFSRYEFSRPLRDMSPSFGTVLTDTGRVLLEKGSVVTKVSKLGCL